MSLPDRLPPWMRNGDFLLVRFMLAVCFLHLVIYR